MKQLFTGCLGIILGLLIGIGVTFAALSLSSQQITPVEPAPTLSAARPDVSVSATTSFINSQIQPMIRQSGLLKQATVALDAPNIMRVVATVDVMVLGQRVTTNATATMRVAVKNNRIALAVEKIEMGNAAIPASLISGTVESLRALAEDQINRLVQRALQGTTLRLIGIAVAPNDLTMQFKAQ